MQPVGAEHIFTLAEQIRKLQKLGHECSGKSVWAPLIVFVDELDAKLFTSLKRQLKSRPRCVCTLVHIQQRMWPESMVKELQPQPHGSPAVGDVMFNRTAGAEQKNFKRAFQNAVKLLDLEEPDDIRLDLLRGDSVLLAMFPLQVFGGMVNRAKLTEIAHRFLYSNDIDKAHKRLLAMTALVHVYAQPHFLPNLAMEVHSLPPQLQMVLLSDHHETRDGSTQKQVLYLALAAHCARHQLDAHALVLLCHHPHPDPSVEDQHALFG